MFRHLSAAAILALSLAGAAEAQPYDPQSLAVQNQIAAEQDNARRQAQDAEREAAVANQRLQTEQRLQSLEESRQGVGVTETPTPPAWSSSRIVDPRGAAPPAPGFKPADKGVPTP